MFSSGIRYTFDTSPNTDSRTLRFGDLNIKNDSDNHSVQTRRVKEAVVHPLYAHPSSYHDVAVWTLDRPVQFTDNVGPVCLPGSPNIHVDKYEGDQVTLTGKFLN